jgi:hypothetical protein
MERENRERTTMDEETYQPDDAEGLREERAAAAEAAEIGGPGPDSEGDEAARPVQEAGGGEAEGFEESERELVEQASHGEDRRTPEVDALGPEDESDRAGAVYSEPDEVDPTEVTRDPREGPDDPGAGPGIAPER